MFERINIFFALKRLPRAVSSPQFYFRSVQNETPNLRMTVIPDQLIGRRHNTIPSNTDTSPSPTLLQVSFRGTVCHAVVPELTPT
jgi:hypothetical protein